MNKVILLLLSIIAFSCNTASYEGMLQERTFHVIYIEKEHPEALDFLATPDHIVAYKGEELILKLKP